MEHGIMPVMEKSRVIGTGHIVRDLDFPGDDVLRVNEDYDVAVDLTNVVHVINFSNPAHPNEYWKICERVGKTRCPACLRMIDPVEMIFNISIGYVPACPHCESPLA